MTATVHELEDLVADMARRDAPRAEATVQAGIRQLLLTAPLNLSEKLVVDLEVQAGAQRRIDIEVGATVIEVKKDLRVGNVRAQAVVQLAGYVASREKTLGGRYVGVLTDGAEWRCYHLKQGALVEVASLEINASRPDVEGLLAWLEGVLATTRNVKPVPEAIHRGLGAGSSAHALDRAALMALFVEHKEKAEVATKRRLWAKLLTVVLGTHFEDSDDLFVEHTLLVNSSSVIAHAVLGFPVEQLSPRSVLTGAKFDESGIHNVVEADFFDWVVEVPEGERFIRSLARRLGRFDWNAVEHDVLKVLYESIIGAETRKKLGEYYTPDWLAQKLTEEVVTAPLTSKVLDPSCGSGTFLFHAVRRYLAAADASGVPTGKALDGVTHHVTGMDLHPVAVILARVTYLLAIGTERLSSEDRGDIYIPVYLGDSMQWSQNKLESLWSRHDLIIQANDGAELVPPEFKFPRGLLRDFQRFDGLVRELSNKSAARKPHAPPPKLSGTFQLYAVAPDDQPTITATFQLMCRLHDEGRDHIWGYYIRNLARPQWLAQPENAVDILLGNPPWLAYRFMPDAMQKDFKSLSEAHGLWHGAKVATHQDLSSLFVVRAMQLYLKQGGHFAFVMPSAVLDRGQFAGFRGGRYDSSGQEIRASFEVPWDLRKLRPHFFPGTCSVIFGKKTREPSEIPHHAERWDGKLPPRHTLSSWGDVHPSIERRVDGKKQNDPEASSPYRVRFRSGATIFPRVLFIVEKKATGPLGLSHGKANVVSSRSSNEKLPWKNMASMHGTIETEFVRPIYLGENLLPYRLMPAKFSVIPRDEQGLMDSGSERLDTYPGLASWWNRAEELWKQSPSSEKLSLLERIDFHKGISSQFPVPSQRILYNGSGMHLTAARTADRRAISEHKLYWATASSDEEALYLCAIMNASFTTQLVRPLMSYSKDPRDIDKSVWQLPIPLFSALNKQHMQLAELGRQAEEAIAVLPLDDKHFAAVRGQIREYLEQSEVGRAIEARVRELLTGESRQATPAPAPVVEASTREKEIDPKHLANKLQKLSKEGKEQEAMDLVVAQVDDWLLAGEAEKVDRLVGALKLEKVTAGVVVAVLSAVQPRRDGYPGLEGTAMDAGVYAALLASAEKQLKKQKQDADTLLRMWR